MCSILLPAVVLTFFVQNKSLTAMGTPANKPLSKRVMNTVILQICTNDLKSLFKKIKNNGGSVLFGPSYDEVDKYWYGSFTDIEGNEIWVVDENCP